MNPNMDFQRMVDEVEKLATRTRRRISAIIVPDNPRNQISGTLDLFEGEYDVLLELRIQDDCLIPISACQKRLDMCYHRPIGFDILMRGSKRTKFSMI
jgi:hypothetical protein